MSYFEAHDNKFIISETIDGTNLTLIDLFGLTDLIFTRQLLQDIKSGCQHIDLTNEIKAKTNLSLIYAQTEKCSSAYKAMLEKNSLVDLSTVRHGAVLVLGHFLLEKETQFIDDVIRESNSPWNTIQPSILATCIADKKCDYDNFTNIKADWNKRSNILVIPILFAKTNNENCVRNQ